MFRRRKLCSTSSPTQGNQVAYEETCDHWAKVTSPYLYVAFVHVYCYAWTTSIRGQGSSWKSHWEWQEREINGEGMSMVWPTLWSRTAKEHTHTHTPVSQLFVRVSRYQKGKTSLDFTEPRDSEWQWHQLGHMQVCISLQTDSHTSTPPLSFYRPDALPAAQPTASKHWRLKNRTELLCNTLEYSRML